MKKQFLLHENIVIAIIIIVFFFFYNPLLNQQFVEIGILYVDTNLWFL